MKVRLPRAPVSFCESATLLSDAGAPALADARAPAAVEECLEGARTCGCPAGEEYGAALSIFLELAFCKTLKNLIIFFDGTCCVNWPVGASQGVRTCAAVPSL